MYTNEDYERLLGDISLDDEPTEVPKPVNNWDYVITEEAQRYPNIPESVVRSLITQESSGDHLADIDTGKYGMARGLGQFIDDTAIRYIPDWKDPSDSYDPVKSVKGIYAYLDDLYTKKGNLRSALISYHGGSENSTDKLGMASGKYADEILGRTDSEAVKPPEVYTNEDYERLLGDVELQPEQATQSTPKEFHPYIGDETTKQEPDFLGDTGKSIFSSALSFAGSMLRFPGYATQSIINEQQKGENALMTGRGLATGEIKSVKDSEGKIQYVNADGSPYKEKESKQAPKWLSESFGLAPKLEKVAKDLSIFKNYSGGDILQELTDDWHNKDVGKASQAIFYGALENIIPSLGAVIATAVTKNPEAAALIMGASSAGGKYGELSERKDISSIQKTDAATANGALEAYFSKLDIGMFDRLLKTAPQKDVRKVVADGIKKSLMSKMKDGMKVAGKAELTNIGEFTNEAATQFSQDMADKIIGVNNLSSQEMIGNALGAGILGHFSSMPLSTMQAAIENKQHTPQEAPQQQQTNQGTQPVDQNAFVEFGTLDAFMEHYNELDDLGKQQMMKALKPEEQAIIQSKLTEGEVESGETIGQEISQETDQGAVQEQGVQAQEGEVLTEPAQQLADVPSVQTVSDPLPTTEEDQPTPLEQAVKESKSKPVLHKLITDTKETTDKSKAALNPAYEIMGVSSINEFRSLTQDEQDVKYAALLDASKEGSVKGKQATDALIELNRVLDLYEEKQASEPAPVETSKQEDVKPTAKTVMFNGTKKDTRRGKTIAREVKGVTFKGVEPGLRQGDDIIEPELKFEYGNKAFSVPLKTTADQLIAKIKTMKKETPNAETIRGDAGRVQERGVAPEKEKDAERQKDDEGNAVSDETVDVRQDESREETDKKEITHKLPDSLFTKSNKEIETEFFKTHISVEGKTRSEDSQYGKKARKAVRVALASKDPKTALDQLAGKTYKELADIADRGSIANKKQLSDAPDIVAETEKRAAVKGIISKFSSTYSTHTPELEQHIKDTLAKKGESEKEKQKRFDQIFKVFADKNGKKIIFVNNFDEFDELRNEKNVNYLDQVKNIESEQSSDNDYWNEDDDVDSEDFGEGTWVRMMKTHPRQNDAVATLEKIGPNDIEWLNGTEKDFQRGKDIASELKNVKFDTVNEGWKSKAGNKDPKFQFTITRDEGINSDTINMPLNATAQDVIKAFKRKEQQRDLERVGGEVKKLLPNVKNFPKIISDNKIVSKSGRVLTTLKKKDAGAIARDEDGSIIIAISPDLQADQILPTLLHELGGHYGMKKVIDYVDGELANHIQELYVKDYGSGLMEYIRKEYPNKKDHFDEWLAYRSEEVLTKFFNEDGTFNEAAYKADKGILQKVYDFINSFTQKLFGAWLQKEATKDELDSAFRAIAQQLSNVTDTGRLSSAPHAKKKSSVPKKEKTIEEKIQKRKLSFKNREEKTQQYFKDWVALNTANADNFRIRFFHFVNTTLYGTANTYRTQLFDMLDKINTFEKDKDGKYKDSKVQELLDTTNEFLKWREATKEFGKFDVFIKKNKKLLSESNPETRDLEKRAESLTEMYNEFVDYQTLRRLDQRELVRRPFKKGTKELTNPSKKYERLLGKDKYVDENFEKDGEVFYKLTDAGKNKLDELQKTVFDTSKIISKFEELKTKIALYKKDRVAEDNVDKKAIENTAEKLTKAIVDLKEKNMIGKIGQFLSRAGYFDVNLEYISDYFDLSTGSKFFTKEIFEPLWEGYREGIKHSQQMNDFLRENLSKKISQKELRSIAPSLYEGIASKVARRKDVSKYNWKLSDKTELELTASQKIAIYMYSQNKEALDHMMEGGIALKDNESIKKITYNDIETLTKSMTANEKYVAKVAFDYAIKQGKKINEVSMADIGMELATVDNYLPIRSKADDITRDIHKIESLNDGSMQNYFRLTNPKFLAKREGSKNAIVIDGVFESIARTQSVVERYVGMAVPATKVEAILNNTEFQKAMTNKKLTIEYNQIKDLVKQYSRPDSYTTTTEKALNVPINWWTRAKLGYKATTAIIQFVGKINYMAEMKDEDFDIKDLNDIKTDVSEKEFMSTRDLITKYSPILRKRFEGIISNSVGDGKYGAKIRSMLSTEHNDPKDIIKAPLKNSMKFMEIADKYTVVWCWKSTAKKLATTYREAGKVDLINTPAFYEHLAPIVEKYIRRSQPTNDVVDRTIAQNSTPIVKMFYLLGTQNLRSMMSIKRNIQTIANSKGDKKVIYKSFGKILMTLSANLAITEVIRTALTGLSGDEDEPMLERIIQKLKEGGLPNIISTINPAAGMVTYAIAHNRDIKLAAPLADLTNSVIRAAAYIKNVITGDEIYDDEEFGKRIYNVAKNILPTEGPKQIVVPLMKAIEGR